MSVLYLTFSHLSVYTYPVKEKKNSFSILYFSNTISVIQLKNQIAALYSSRSQSTKNFEIDGCGFGWRAVEDQYKRDKLRTDQGCAPRVPGLRYNFVYRDVWTRLNVFPAKIMQVHNLRKCHLVT